MTGGFWVAAGAFEQARVAAMGTTIDRDTFRLYQDAQLARQSADLRKIPIKDLLDLLATNNAPIARRAIQEDHLAFFSFVIPTWCEDAGGICTFEPGNYTLGNGIRLKPIAEQKLDGTDVEFLVFPGTYVLQYLDSSGKVHARDHVVVP